MNFCFRLTTTIHTARTQSGEIQISSPQIVAFVAHKAVPGWDATLRNSLIAWLDDLAGKGNIRVPEVRTFDDWASVGVALGNFKPKIKIAQLLTHGQRAIITPLEKIPARFEVDKAQSLFIDDKEFINLLQNYDCVLATACHSYEIIALTNRDEEDDNKIKGLNIKHLIVCEDRLSDDEAVRVSGAFYGALLYHKLTIASAARVASEFLDQVIGQTDRSVKLHYYHNGIKKPFDEIVFEKALSM